MEKQQIGAFEPGFGTRLKEERSRLGLNQTEFSKLGGVQRIAQSQYELEQRIPSIRYLSLISSAGVNLYYLLYGKFASFGSLPPSKQHQIEKQVFQLIEEYARDKYGGDLSAEGRFVLFDVMRAHLVQVSLGRSGEDVDISKVLTSGNFQNEKL